MGAEMPGDYVAIHSALWEDTKRELHRVTIVHELLQAKWDAVPWSAIAYCVNVADRVAPNPETVEAYNWLDANAPKEAGE